MFSPFLSTTNKHCAKNVGIRSYSGPYFPALELNTERPILFIFFISSLFKVDLHLAYKKPINANNNTAYISVNKHLSNNDNNKTKYLIVRQNQHVANRLYITYMTNQASTFLLFVWKILDFWKITICDCFGDKCPYFWSYVRHGLDILQNWDFYFEERFVS